MPLEPFEIPSNLRPVNEAGIYADSSAMLALQVAVREGFGGVAGQEMETGGLLLGGGGGAEVRIEAVRPVPIEYRFGPSFWLSSADVDRWKQAISQATGGGRLEVVGHYRSMRTGGPGNAEPDVQDVDHAIADLLRFPEPIVLLIPATGATLIEALVYRRIGATWTPLIRCRLTDIPKIPLLPPQPAQALAPLRQIVAPEAPLARSPVPSRRRALAPWVLLLAALLVTCVILWLRPTVPPPASASPSRPVVGTELRAERQGEDLKILWDLNSAAVAGATSGVLDIDDGGVKRLIHLTAGQVRFGSLLYSPASAEVAVQLTTFKDNQRTAQGSILALLKRPPQPQPQSANGRQPVAVPFEVQTQPLKATRKFEPPAVKGRTKSPDVSDDLPAVQTKPQPLAAPSLLSTVPVAPPPPAAVPDPAPPAPAVASSRSEPDLTRTEDYVGAVLIAQEGMRLPAELPRMIKPVAISVRVTINESGRVTHTEATAPKGTHSLLLQAAADAAWKCRFKPARQGQRPISSSLTIVFHVGPGK